MVVAIIPMATASFPSHVILFAWEGDNPYAFKPVDGVRFHIYINGELVAYSDAYHPLSGFGMELPHAGYVEAEIMYVPYWANMCIRDTRVSLGHVNATGQNVDHSWILPSCQCSPGTPPPSGSTPFTDIWHGAPYSDAVRYVFEQDIMRGTSETTFSPNSTLTRAMVATILHRMAEEPDTAFRPGFDDVVAGRWYSDAVTWANDIGIVQGVGGGRFAPNAQLTIEQLSAMMYRFAQEQGFDMSVPANVTAPSETSAWAVQYVRWAVHYHLLILGTNPRADASRGETALVVYQFSQLG